MKKRFRVLSVFLSIFLTVTSLPLSAFAVGAVLEEDEAAHDVSVTVAEDTAIELTDRRTENTKTFLLSDGSYYLAQYATDVHYVDEDGAMQPIDTTLSEVGNEISTADARIKFAKKTNGSEALFTLHDTNRKLTLSLDGATKKIVPTITNTVGEDTENLPTLEKMTALSGLSASVRYSDILPSTDLEYCLEGANIKENIIVKEPRDAYVYSFTLSLNNLTAQQLPSGDILLLDNDSGDRTFLIPSPVMWDADGVTSEAVQMSLSDLGNGKYSLVVNADAAWMNATERVYPVTIDPPIYTGTAASEDGVVDLSILSSIPTSNTKGATQLTVRSDARAYWKLNTLPTLPKNAYISEATFRVHGVATAAVNGYVGIFPVESAWSESLTWNLSVNSAQGTPASSYVDYFQVYTMGMTGTTLSNQGVYNFTITSIVREWYEGTNYGLMIGAVPGADFSGTLYFYSSEYSSATQRPQLCIAWRDMKGVEDYWTFSSQSAGFAGVASVNHATGNLVLTIPTLTTTDALMPTTPSLVYNSQLAGKAYTSSNAETSYTASFLPRGFKLNFAETLLQKTYPGDMGEAVTRYVWADGDGTEHYFAPISAASGETVYSDEDGLLLRLQEGSTTCTITDSNQTVRTFASMTAPGGATKAWYLKSISDKNGNKLLITFDSSLRPTAISLLPNGRAESSRIEQLRLRYNSDGVLYLVYNATSGDAVLFRYSYRPTATAPDSTGSRYLSRVIRAHGGSESAYLTYCTSGTASGFTVDAIAEYTYDSAGRLTSVKNGLSQYCVNYTYTNGKVTSIVESATNADGSGTGQRLSLMYGDSTTVIRTSGTDDALMTSDDLLTTCAFDREGRTVSCYTTDVSRTQLYGASSGVYVSEDENANAKNNLKSSVVTSLHSSNYFVNGGFEDGSSSWNPTSNVTVVTDDEGPDLQKLRVRLTAANGSASLSQNVKLEKGKYTFSVEISSFASGGVSIALQAVCVGDSTKPTLEYTVPVNEYGLASQITVGLPVEVEPDEEGACLEYSFRVVVNGTVSEDVYITLDDAMLSRTTGAAPMDLLTQGHFETDTHPLSDGWTVVPSGSSAITTEESAIGAFGEVLKVQNSLGSAAYVTQTVSFSSAARRSAWESSLYLAGNEPVLFTVSGWGKGTDQALGARGEFAIVVQPRYYHPDRGGLIDGTAVTLAFQRDFTDWQFVSECFATDPSLGLLEEIELRILYSGHTGVGYFDGISLAVNSEGASLFDYSAAGYLTTYRKGESQAAYTYDANGNVTSCVTSDFQWIDYTYDSHNRLTSETHSTHDGVLHSRTGNLTYTTKTANYTKYYYYDTFGLLTETVLKDAANGATAQMTSRTAYNYTDTHIFGTVKTQTDSLGRTTRYFHDAATGRLQATVSPDGTGVSYSYDAIGNLLEVLPADVTEEEYEIQIDDDNFITQIEYGYVEDSASASVNYTYDTANRLSTVASESTTYTFTYDVFGNTSSIQAGSATLASYTYNANNGKLATLTYGNGLTVQYTYDHLDRIIQICYNELDEDFETIFVPVYSYTYNSAGAIHTVTDHTSGEVTLYGYDSAGKFLSATTYDEETGITESHSAVTYDAQSRINFAHDAISYTTPTGAQDAYVSTYYAYAPDTGNLSYATVNTEDLTGEITPTYDAFGRTTRRVTSFAEIGGSEIFQSVQSYVYKASGYEQSLLISRVTASVRRAEGEVALSSSMLDYTYDDNGNITKIATSAGVIQYQYHYDDLGQLIREDNRPLGKTFVYTYDNAGNRTCKKTYSYTSTTTLGTASATENYFYLSGWGDRLECTSSGYVLSYDAIGNPTTVETPDSEMWTLTWEGRQLQRFWAYSFSTGAQQTLDFTYNADGIRTSKTVNGIVHEYLLSGSKIIAETWVQNSVEHVLLYLYDEIGAPIGLQYRNSNYAVEVYDSYFFEKNLQGDIVAIYNEAGTKICTYTYDAWGNHTVSLTSGISTLDRNVANTYNPFRYRGYYYDVETELYYLQSRYYNPAWGRFINADGVQTLSLDPCGVTNKNLYAYCDNNPVVRLDESGDFWFTTILLKAAVGAVINAVVEVATQVITEGKVSDWKAVGLAAAAGAVSGTIAGVVGPIVTNPVVSMGIDMVCGVVEDTITGEIDLASETVDLEVMESLVSSSINSTVANRVFNGVVTRNKKVFNKLNRQGKKLVLVNEVFGGKRTYANLYLRDYASHEMFTSYIERGAEAASQAVTSALNLARGVIRGFYGQ